MHLKPWRNDDFQYMENIGEFDPIPPTIVYAVY